MLSIQQSRSQVMTTRIDTRAFPVDDDAVYALAMRIVAWLQADQALKESARAALVSVVRERWSWEGVARGVIGAARGEPVARPFG